MKKFVLLLLLGALGLGACSTTKTSTSPTTSIDSSGNPQYNWDALMPFNNKLINDNEAMSTAAGNSDLNSLIPACSKLVNDATAYKAFLINHPTPNVAMNSDLERGLTYEMQAGGYCENGDLDSAASYLTQATTFLQKASTDLGAG